MVDGRMREHPRRDPVCRGDAGHPSRLNPVAQELSAPHGAVPGRSPEVHVQVAGDKEGYAGMGSPELHELRELLRDDAVMLAPPLRRVQRVWAGIAAPRPDRAVRPA